MLTDQEIIDLLKSPEGYKFSAKGITKIDVWPHGGHWFPLYSLEQVKAVIAAHEAKAVTSRADQLVRKYIECLVTNDPDGASDATKSMVDYVFNCPPATAHEAKAAPAVPQGWQVERKSDHRIRVQSPSGEAWSFEHVDDRGSANLFVYQMLDAMLSATPAAPSQPVVPEAIEPQDWFESSEQEATETAYCNGWNDCRAAMLAATTAAPSQPSKYGSPELQALIVAHATQSQPTWDQNADVCKGAWSLGTACGKCAKCIATKPAQEPVTLTDEEIGDLARPYGRSSINGFDHIKGFARAIIAALREKQAKATP